MIIKILVTAVLLAAVYFFADIPELISVLGGLNVWMLTIAVLLLLLLRVISALRWQIVLSTHDLKSSFLDILKITFVSHSIGYLSPGGLGTDIVKMHLASTVYGETPTVISTVIIDRVIGLISMLAIALVIGIYLSQSDNQFVAIVWSSLSLLFCVFFFIAALATGAEKKILALLPSRLISRILPGLKRLLRSLADAHRNLFLMIPITILSLLMQVVRSLTFWAIFWAMDANVSAFHCLVFVPLVFVVLTIPISIGGLGVREVSLAMLFARVGLEPETSIAAGLTFFGLQICLILPGLVIFLASPLRFGAKNRGYSPTPPTKARTRD